jgi:hypothetical protein
MMTTTGLLVVDSESGSELDYSDSDIDADPTLPIDFLSATG